MPSFLAIINVPNLIFIINYGCHQKYLLHSLNQHTDFFGKIIFSLVPETYIMEKQFEFQNVYIFQLSILMKSDTIIWKDFINYFESFLECNEIQNRKSF